MSRSCGWSGANRHAWCQNAYVERFIGSLRRECLDHVVTLGERNLLTVEVEYVDYNNTTRPHQSLNGDAPEHRQVDARDGPVIGEPVLGGLLYRYRRAA